MIAPRARRAIAVGSLALCACATPAAGCGGTEEPAPTPVVVAGSADAGRLDPALASTSAARQAVWLAYTPLLTYRHADGERGAELIAGLASDLPEVSGDGRTWSLKLRDGLEYSDGSPVRATDFEHAVARTLALGSPGAALYERIEGAREVERGGASGEIAGIDADDDSGEIKITLDAPDPDFADALAQPYAAPVPAGTPARDLSATPPPGVGPYELGDPDPDGGFVMRRSERFADLDIPDVPTGNVTEIRTQVVPAAGRQAQGVLDGRLDYMQDQVPRSLRPTVAQQASDRFAEDGLAATVLLTLDSQRPPFDDPLVREAVNRAVDRGRLASLHGDMVAGCALLAPGVPGYDERLDTAECPYGDPESPPDRSAARDLVHQAGAEGAAVAIAGEPGQRRLLRAYAAELRDIGLRPELGAGAARAQTTLRTIAPQFPRALDFLRELGSADPLAVAEADRLAAPGALDPDTDEIRHLDEYLVSPPQGYFVALGHPSTTTLLSERIDPQSAVLSPLFGVDYASWLLKEGEM